ncbi:MAG: DUF928 domain-containing protein [Aphanocapsa sp. GSE-SYN-MK-11-07L]|nr:DUF928 domain-containing protein [Aphanocapsa sp. GSE-SYN-MK-11-07L]
MATSFCLQGGPAWAGYIPPANLGRPGNREGAATRSACLSANTLTALVPLSNLGLTTEGFPTFYWYVPQNNCLAEFRLVEVDPTNNNETVIYLSRMDLSGAARVVGLSLPKDGSVLPLKVGKEYFWDIGLVALTSAGDPPSNFVKGWVKRVEPSASLAAALQTAKGIDRYEAYANAGLWYDALNTLVQLRQATPNNSALNQAWSELLNSDAVELQAIAGPSATQ